MEKARMQELGLSILSKLIFKAGGVTVMDDQVTLDNGDEFEDACDALEISPKERQDFLRSIVLDQVAVLTSSIVEDEPPRIESASAVSSDASQREAGQAEVEPTTVEELLFQDDEAQEGGGSEDHKGTTSGSEVPIGEDDELPAALQTPPPVVDEGGSASDIPVDSGEGQPVAEESNEDADGEPTVEANASKDPAEDPDGPEKKLDTLPMPATDDAEAQIVVVPDPAEAFAVLPVDSGENPA